MSVIRETKKRALGVYVTSSDNKSKAIWRVINGELARAEKSSVGYPSITPDEFNNTFITEVDDIVRAITQDISSGSYSGVYRRVDNIVGSFLFSPVTAVEVHVTICNLRNSESTDCYGLGAKILKATADLIVPTLTILFNRCIDEGRFPKPFKISKVVPIFKKGSKSCPSNYRPIALIPLFGKVFESLIKERLCGYFESRGLFSRAQFGFRPSYSTYDALAGFVGGVVDGFESGQLTAGLLFDLRKAFDCVSHEILIGKLERYGIRGLPLKLFRDYLSDRYQFVSAAGGCSQTQLVRLGVPQGSILGPILFNIYINDLPDFITAGKVILFADDTSVLVSGNTRHELEMRVRSVEKEIFTWFSCNKLKINNDKTQKIMFSPNPSIYMGATVKLLGVLLDDSLRWSEHVGQLCNKLSSQIFALRRLSRLVDRDVLLVAYHALFHSHIKYCTNLWGHSTFAKQVFKQQKRAVRAMCHKGPRYSCRGLFAELKILTVSSELILSTVVQIHKSKASFTLHSDLHSYPTRGNSLIVAPALRLAASVRNSLDVHLYNKLPSVVKSLNITSFKRRVKSYLTDKVFYTCQEYLQAPSWSE